MTAPKKIFFDGGCRPNPGIIEIAVVACGTIHIRRDHGTGSSMDAEWLALMHALRVCQTLAGACVLLGDALAVIDQANGKAKCRGSHRVHFEALHALAGAAGLPRVRYIKRAQNLAGIALAAHHSGRSTVLTHQSD